MNSASHHTAPYFVALRPPPHIQAQVTAIKQEIWAAYHSKAALKSPPHITLHPPFLWPQADDGSLQEGLSEFARQQPPVPITLTGFGAFPPRVIYVAVMRQGPLMTIQPALLDYVAETLGIVDEKAQNRPFAPHMTVAFRDLKPASFRRAWSKFKQREFKAEFITESLTLLKHDGKKWQVFADFPLKG